MCRLLKVSRSYFYKVIKLKGVISEFQKELIERDKLVLKSHEVNHKVYGAIKNSIYIEKYYNCKLSRYQVAKSMKKQCLKSIYNSKNNSNRKNYHKTNKENIGNILNQKFNSANRCNKIVCSDLTYYNSGQKFIYICFITDIYNREIVGYSVGEKHNTDLVIDAITKSNLDLNTLEVFHSDRGGEFKGHKFIDLMQKFNITRSLSKSGYPYDNAVAEKVFDILKREWLINKLNLDVVELKSEVNEFVRWYNYFRLHGSNNYLTPIEKRFHSQA